MNKLKLIIISLTLIILFTGCKTIKQKTDEIVEKENNPSKRRKYAKKKQKIK